MREPRMPVPVTMLVLGAMTLVQSSPAHAVAAQQPTPASPPTVTVTEARPGLLRLASIAPQVAERTALAAVPDGRIASGRIEEVGRRRRLVYDFRIEAGATQHDVRVDAVTGKVIADRTAAKPPSRSVPQALGGVR